MLTVGALRAVRTGSQLLGGERAADPADVVARLGAVQAQDLAATRMAIRVRSERLTVDQVDLDSPAFVRTWLMRGTLHLVAAQDVRWMLGLLGPGNQAGDARRRRQLGLDDGLCARALSALPEALADGALGRTALVERLAGLGVVLGPDGQAAPHLLAYAAAAGVICLGPELSHGRPSYLLLDARAPADAPLHRDAALAELARRYLRGHQPAGPADLAGWSGLGVRDAKAAFALLAGELIEVATATGPGATLGPVMTPEAGPVIRMVGHFDPYLLGYADKTAAVPREFVTRVRTGGGFVTPTVLVDGRAVAIWRLKGNLLTVEPFAPLPDDLRASIEAEITDIGRFLGAPVTTRPGSPGRPL